MTFTLHVYDLTFMAGVGGNSGGFKRGGCQASDRGIFLTRDHDIRTSITAGFHRVCHSSFQQRPRSGFLSLSAPQGIHAESTVDVSRPQPHQSAQSRSSQAGSQTAEMHGAPCQFSK